MEKFTYSKCEKCGKTTVLNRAVCNECKGRNFSKVEYEGLGTLLTFTKLYATPEGIDEMPLVLGILKLDNMKVTGQVADQNVKVGDKLKPVWGKLRKMQGKEIYGFRFQPVEKL